MKKRAPYDPAAIEKKWQKKWASSKLYQSKESAKKDKFYVLDMFPYPSGEGLHVGHPKGYIATDVVSRMKRMQGRSVLHPMGFDAFGLPAENYAIKTKTNPADSVKKNVARYKEQLEILGFDYDWSREVNTTDPDYYRWTQWIFLQLFKKGLAYESNEPVNWCPTDKTVLANEDVENGRCERCGTLVEKKPMRQWVLKITDYADRLLKDLDMKALPNGDYYGTMQNGDPYVVHMNKIGPGKVRQDKPFVERQAISAFVEHWSEDKFIVLKWKKVDWMTPITGGIEKDQSAEEAARAEIMQETGYKNLELVKIADKRMHSTFFHVPKDENRIGHFTCFHFKLKDGARDEITDDEKAIHEITWVERNKVREMLTTQAQKIAWALVMNESSGEGVKPLLNWPESIKEAQRNWIGRSEGVNLRFKVKDLDMHFEMYDSIPQTFMAQTFTIIAPEHSQLAELVKGTPQEKEVLAFAEAMKVKKAREGFDHVKDMEGIFTGRYIEYTPSGRLLPIWVASYAVVDYGSGIVNCSFHDERDYAFAKKYDIPLHPVLFPEDEALAEKVRKQEVFYREPNGILTEPAEFRGRRWDEARKGIIDLIVKNAWGTRAIQYKLRDWVFSRQRYWGEPIPVIHCPECGVVPVPEKDLPVKLPKVKSYEPTGTGESPLAAIDKWVNVKCPKCGGKGKRETNTMPQWAGSSWYYLRYMDPRNKKSLVDLKKEKYWSPVDLYVGGAEHATRHLIYARFWHKFLYDIGAVTTIEPFHKLQSVGLIMGEDGRKMSKRFGNVVNPDDIVKTYGADTLRIYEMFMGPFDQAIPWSTESIIGSRRFIERVWKLVEKVTTDKSAPTGNKILHKTIKKVSDDIQGLRFNTAISSLMIAANELEKLGSLDRATYEAYLKLFAPFAPHVTEDLWSQLGNKKSIHISSWPEYDPAMLIEDEARITLQVNGKTRGSFMAATGAGKDELEKLAREAPEAQKWIEGKKIERVIAIPGKLVNIVAI